MSIEKYLKGVIHIEVKELTDKERLELALQYSISGKHKKSILKRINAPKEPEKKEKKKTKLDRPEQIKFC